MNKLTKWIVGAFCAVALATTAFAAENTSLYNAGELGLTLGTGYVVDRTALFQQPYSLNISAGAFYFPWRNLGLEATVPFWVNNGTSVSEVQAGLLVRLPLAETKPFWKSVSPYLGVDGVYNWKDAANWAYIGKAGVEFRLTKSWGVFFEGQYRNDTFSNMSNGQTSVLGGLHLVL